MQAAWQGVADAWFYVCIQRHYPGPGNMCSFSDAGLPCRVVSNHYGNRAVVLEVQDAAWQGAYILLTYCWRWGVWPTGVTCFIDCPDKGSITRAFYLEKQEVAPQPAAVAVAEDTAAEQVDALERFDARAAAHRTRWSPRACRPAAPPPGTLAVADWRVQSARIMAAARVLQRQWRRSVSDPRYEVCRRRLEREFGEMRCLRRRLDLPET